MTDGLAVLVVDDDANVREGVREALSSFGHQVTEAEDGAAAVELLAHETFDVAICDVHMPRLDGMSLFRRIRRDAPGTAVVIMTSYARIPDAIDSVRDGAVDYVTKPFDPDDFARTVVAPIAVHKTLRKKFEAARAELVAATAGAKLVTWSPAMRALSDRIAVLASSDASVVVTGGRGTGKELVARTLHVQGVRRDGPLVIVEGSTLAEVLEAGERRELGVEGAHHDAWLRAAMGGTLVLDGLEHVSLAAQARLLRAIGEPGVTPRRGPGGRPLGVRLVTLTREALADRAARGEMVESLYYRLAGVQLHVPTLAERREDLAPLVTQLLRELQPPMRTLPGITPGAWRALSRAPFEGNVRQLRWALEHALAMAEGGPLALEHLPDEVRSAAVE